MAGSGDHILHAHASSVYSRTLQLSDHSQSLSQSSLCDHSCTHVSISERDFRFQVLNKFVILAPPISKIQATPLLNLHII